MAELLLNTETVLVQSGGVELEADLTVPRDAAALVLFAHGSGSGRFSPRNRAVASLLHEAALGTMLLDLLTPTEQAIDEQTRELRFNIELLSARLTGAVDWCARDARTRALPLGLYGASTGAAAALMTAAERPAHICAVVSRGGRPDLAAKSLPLVKAPTLLIVGGNDSVVIELNEQASHLLRAPHQIQIVSGAGHLFEEPGKLTMVAQMTVDWFRHCRR